MDDDKKTKNNSIHSGKLVKSKRFVELNSFNYSDLNVNIESIILHMKKSEKSETQKRLQSFIPAWKGLKYAFKSEKNLRIQGICGLLAISLGVWLEINLTEWTILLFLVSMILAAEIFNSALESLGDAIDKNHNELIGRAKDLSAGAVLLLSISSVIIGGIIFIPKVIKLLN